MTSIPEEVGATGLLRRTGCALCGPGREADDQEMYEASFTPADLNETTFSARRVPDGIHCRIVRCRRCGLVRSDPAPDPSVLSTLYRASGFDYASAVPNLIRTYGRQLRRLAGRRQSPSAFLEIGSGSGFMLEEALRLGYEAVQGIEPSVEAVASAPPHVRPHLINDVLRPGPLPEGAYDVACMFQVLDHLPDPGAALDEIRRALKPDGLLLVINHNVRAVSARVLGRRSPIIDLEHTYLYDPRTAAQLCRRHGFEVERVGPVWNWCSLGYLSHLLPLSSAWRRKVSAALVRLRVESISVPLPLGNLCLVARKPGPTG